MTTFSGPSSQESIRAPQKVIIHVLSPSIEVPNKLTFAELPTSITIGELKKKICDAVPARPAPQRQRLIYRGKALVNDGTSLKDIFTQETVRLGS